MCSVRFETQNFNFKTKFDMEHKTSTNHENGNDANRLLAVVAIDRDKDFDDRDEIYCNWYICPSCKSKEVRSGDNYCSNCGCKFVWSGDYR